MKASVVTLRGVSPEEAREILIHAESCYPDAAIKTNGQTVLSSEEEDVIIRYYLLSGDELDLLSCSLSHEELLRLLPTSLRGRATCTSSCTHTRLPA